ncbi:hypothetical protein SBA4_640017 [Candidatus Sulfopaludibacter sp. SbA4]|nr:hypothetical protein SBA4_640017 [Candidatus Sulfopaludibacter sp. SbA4]
MSPFRRVIRRTYIALIILLAGFVITCLMFLVWEFKCDMPTDEAQRVLVWVVKVTETRELAKSGKLGDIDAGLRSGPRPHVIGLDHYRIVVRQTPDGYDVVIKPTGWCFCRSTFILRDNGKRLETVHPLSGGQGSR